MWYLALRTARTRVAALVAVVCAVLGGAALVTANGVLAESGLRSHAAPGRLAGADVVVTADQSLHPAEDLAVALPERRTVPADLVDQLAALPGVAAAVGDVAFPAALVAADGRVVRSGDDALAGHGWSSTELLAGAQVQGAAPTGAGEVAVDAATASAAHVRPGDRVRVVAGGRPATYHLTAVVSGAPAGVLFADPTAAQLAGRDAGPRAGSVDLVGLRAEPGRADALAEAVRAELSGTSLVVATGAARGDTASVGAAAARGELALLASSLSGTVLLVVGFIVAGAMGVVVAAQRQDLALLRAVGATPRQVRRLAAGQATAAAVPALLVGVGLGYPLAAAFRVLLVRTGVVPADLPLSWSPLPALVAALLVLAVVRVSGRAAARRTSRAPATEAVAESVPGPRAPSRARTAVGLLLIASALPMALVPAVSRTLEAAVAAPMSGLVAAVGLAVAAPAVLSWAGRAVAARVPAGASAPSWLAARNLGGGALRGAGAVATLALVVVLVLTDVLTHTTVMAAASREARAGTLATTSISAPALGGVGPDAVAAAAAVPGVRAAVASSSTTVVWPSRVLDETIVQPQPALVLAPAAVDVLDLGVRSGSLSDLTGATVALGSDVARRRSAQVGSEVALVLGDGASVRARVVAVYDRSLGFGPFVLSADLAAGHTTTPLASSVLVRTDGTAAAQDRLAELVASRPGLVLARADAGGTGLGSAPPEVWVNLAASLVLLGYVLLGVANTLVAGTARRRREFAALRLLGATPRQVTGLVRREALLLAALAVVAGVLLSAVPLASLGVGFLGRPWPSGPGWLLPVTALGTVAIALAATALPARRATRTPPLP
ncbi:ABC transporter permease [Quadrisphaera sp. DSM 44207]|uniref:ABC transporter permease n=1 Tax=Quadrisphaera sp. DSM 44207 TaxID=1881057 RepID=UPI000890DC39|nr:ABC transporter permease [Quadrisphaera sp. DSM 44207]SDQ87295.1 putative ABC transport system permease protein [Quadrisphaera sp. DSM 44207]